LQIWRVSHRICGHLTFFALDILAGPSAGGFTLLHHLISLLIDFKRVFFAIIIGSSGPELISVIFFMIINAALIINKHDLLPLLPEHLVHLRDRGKLL
jgi:hypothetical protein